MNTLLKVEKISVSFDGFKAINNLSYSIGKNELKAIIGPNGAGKTTFMDIITGQTKPDEGKVLFGERSVWLESDQKYQVVWDENLLMKSESQIALLGIGRKFQRPTVFELKTVFENLFISMKKNRNPFSVLFQKLNEDEKNLIENILGEISLTNEQDRIAGELSHGQKQWLEIGMLLTQEPKLLLIDEPAAGMTANERRQTVEILKKLSEDKSVIVVEHDMEFVKDLECEVTVLHEGSILSEGSIEHVSSNNEVIEVYLGR
jgi:urea transport system ATP-binding protein|tara:strand:+ start:633 stop:1415 length:783 start_codon:yes stop_codon:yes gene_type:complete